MTQSDLDPNLAAHNHETDDIEEMVQDVHTDRDFVTQLCDAIDKDDNTTVHALVDELHAADFADVFEAISSSHRSHLIALLGDTLPADVLSEIEGQAQDELYEQLSNEQIADAVSEMETDDAVYVLEEMDEEDQQEILSSLEPDDRAALEESLSYPEDSAGRLMQRDLIAMPEFWNVGQAIDYMRKGDEDFPEDFYNVFIVDPAYKPIGSVALSSLISSGREVKLKDIMRDEPYVIKAEEDQEDVAYQFSKYHLISAAVTNEHGRLVGMITVDDVVDVIEEEVEEDILALVGVHEEGPNETVVDITRTRFSWLFINLITAVLASTVIAAFDATIEQMVALAVLMPIVASMGGNAGTQTMTVAVRALATKELNPNNAFRILNKELAVALINGAMLAIVSGIVAWLWFDSQTLGLVFGAAMIVNLFVAGLFGLLIPLMLDKMNVDPAVSSSVFVTTITDVVGFFAFLGLAAVVLL